MHIVFFCSIIRKINSVSGSISCIFLLVTFAVYLAVPEFNNLHGSIVISNITTIILTTAYLLLVYNLTHTFATLVCKVIGYLGYFFAMSMFSWMTIMSFDICWTFNRAKLPKKGSISLR